MGEEGGGNSGHFGEEESVDALRGVTCVGFERLVRVLRGFTVGMEPGLTGGPSASSSASHF